MTASTPSVNRRRWSLRTGVVVALVVSAVPASAAVVIQNFMSAEVNRAAACLRKVDGGDAATAPIARDLTNVSNSTDGVPLLNEKITLTGYIGDRLTVTDAVRVRNVCTHSVQVFLKAEPGLAAATTSGDWRDLSMKVYLGVDPITPSVSGPPAAALSLIDYAVAADWDNDPLEINPSGNGAALATAPAVIADDQTGTYTLAAGREVQLGFLVDVGAATAAPASPAAGGANAVLNYTVNAQKV